MKYIIKLRYRYSFLQQDFNPTQSIVKPRVFIAFVEKAFFLVNTIVTAIKSNLLTLITIIFKGTWYHGIIILLTWQTILEGEPRLAPLNDVKHELSHDLNLMQLAKHEKLARRKNALG
jgi:hypothetical protein